MLGLAVALGIRIGRRMGAGASGGVAPSAGDALLLESADFLLLESGDKLLLE